MRRPDERWTVYDVEHDASVLPARFEPLGLEQADAVLLTAVLNTISDDEALDRSFHRYHDA